MPERDQELQDWMESGAQIVDSRRSYAPPKAVDQRTTQALDRVAEACAKGAGWNHKPRAKPVQRERGEQIVLAEFLDLACAPLVRSLGLDAELCAGWCHVANERSSSEQRHASLANQGVKRGVVDCLIWVVPTGATFGGVALELKEPNAHPSAVSEQQREWLAMHKARGWEVRACFGADQAIEWLRGLGYGT